MLPPASASCTSTQAAAVGVAAAAAVASSHGRAESGACASSSGNSSSSGNNSSSSSSSMRRVASSPAFKGVQHTGSSSSSSSSSSSAAVKAGVVAEGALEVYVVARAFAEFGGPVLKRMSPEMRTSLLDVGVCHYMTVFKTPSGELVQFDFGPRGGDVQKTAPRPLRALLSRAQANAATASASKGNAHGLPVASLALGAGHRGSCNGGSGSGGLGSGGLPSSSSCAALAEMMAAQEAADVAAAAAGGDARRPLPITGEVREAVLEQLPPAHLYVGRCPLSIDDIRSWNSSMGCKEYRLHTNDCRHYVNSLVQYATGLEGSTQHLKRHHFKSRTSGRFVWHGWFVEAGQLLTDVGNWHRFQIGAAAAALLVTGRSTVAQLKPLLLPLSPLVTSVPMLLPAAKAQLLKRPLASGAVAAAGGAAVAMRSDRRLGGAQAGEAQMGNRFAMSLRGAAMALRRAALGQRGTVVTGTMVTEVAREAAGNAADAEDGSSSMDGARAAVAPGGNGLGVQVGRHVMWLTSGAARATGAFATAAGRHATAAGRRMGALLPRPQPHLAPFDAATARSGGSGSGRGEFGGLFVLNGAAPNGSSGLLGGRSKESGGRQVLRLPAPKLAWVRNRATAALVMQ